MGIETLLSQLIFVVFERELLPKFSIVTNFFLIISMGYMRLRPRHLHFRFELNIERECYFG